MYGHTSRFAAYDQTALTPRRNVPRRCLCGSKTDDLLSGRSCAVGDFGCTAWAGAECTLESESNDRSEGRSNVFLGGTLETEQASNAVRIRNLSYHGALVEGPILPSVGAKVRLLRGS